MIFTNINSKFSFKTVDDLKDKIIAVNENNPESIRIINNIKGIKLLKLNSTKEVINAVTTGQADAMLGNAAMFYILNKQGNPFLKPSIILDEKSLDLVFSFSKDLTPAVTIVNKALDIIGKQKLLELKKYWFEGIVEKNNKSKNITHLLNKQIQYLEKKQFITMCIDPNWMPFEKFDKDGNHIGISKDYFNLFEKQLGIPIKVIKTKSWSETLEFAKMRQCDIISMAMKTESRKQYMNFTTPYLSIPLVIATKKTVSFIDDVSQLKNKKVGLVQGYALVEILRKKYTNLNIVEVKSATEGLEKVKEAKHFGFIGSIADIGYILKTTYIGNLKITGKFNERWELGVAVRNDDLVLLNIFEKLIQNISKNEKQNILNKYISIKYEKGIDYTLIWKMSIGFIVAIFIFVFFLIRQNILRKEIEHLNKNLELKISQEVEKNRQKDTMIFRQSKLASMGEMIGNIAHQWRQPLNRINLSLAVIDEILSESIVDKNLIKNKILNSQKNLKYMSNTIEDFANFFKKDKIIEKFNILEVINQSIELLGNRLENINLIIDKKEDIIVKTYKNELLQVILIILNNALDNFKIEDVDKPNIDIILESKNNNLLMSIKDNGGGIKNNNIDKIFDPYFTTKFKNEGTGIGLYMAKMLIEDSMHGILDVASNEVGVTFIIKLKKEKNKYE
jgi:signal transduction histidine kinase